MGRGYDLVKKYIREYEVKVANELDIKIDHIVISEYP